MNAQWIRPDWPAAPKVHALITTRAGGVSRGHYGVPPHDRGGMNIGLASGDDIADVMANRALLRAALPANPCWLNQVHGAAVIDAAQAESNAGVADASFADTPNVVCAVSIADCMPVLLADTSGRCVGVAHAGWRGLASGVIQATVKSMRQRLEDAGAELLAYLGPTIGPRHLKWGPMCSMRCGRTCLTPTARSRRDRRASILPTCSNWGGRHSLKPASNVFTAATIARSAIRPGFIAFVAIERRAATRR